VSFEFLMHTLENARMMETHYKTPLAAFLWPIIMAKE